MFLTRAAIAVIFFLISAVISQPADGQKRPAPEAAALRTIGDAIGLPQADFIKQAKDAGFAGSKLKDDDGLTLITLSGRLGSQRRCKLLTATGRENGSRILYASIFLPERGKWIDLKSDYDGLKGSLEEVYGAPVETAEAFADGTSADDASRMEAVKTDRADFTSKFDKGRLTVMLSITYSEEKGAHVGILFIDSEVSENILGTIGGE